MTATDAKGGRPAEREPEAPAKITRDDIEAKFRTLTGDVDDIAEDARSTAVTVGAVVAAAVVIGVFLFGRSRGRKKTTMIEVRRF